MYISNADAYDGDDGNVAVHVSLLSITRLMVLLASLILRSLIMLVMAMTMTMTMMMTMMRMMTHFSACLGRYDMI